MPEFDPANATADNIETLSLLGPFLRLTAYPDSAVCSLFARRRKIAAVLNILLPSPL